MHIVTADDTEVIVRHARLWSTSVFNASSGKPSLLCVTDFYLHADHDGAAVHQSLAEIGETSTYRLPALERSSSQRSQQAPASSPMRSCQSG